MIPNTYIATYDLIKKIINKLGIVNYKQSNKEDFFQIEIFKASTIYRIINYLSNLEDYFDNVVEEGNCTIEINILVKEDMSIIILSV